jgi:hypothetical protein
MRQSIPRSQPLILLHSPKKPEIHDALQSVHLRIETISEEYILFAYASGAIGRGHINADFPSRLVVCAGVDMEGIMLDNV